MADEITDEERLQIAQHYLLSSPPSQFGDILVDVRKLLPPGLLTDALATGIARVYNTRNQKVVTAPSGRKVNICSAGEVDATHFVDPTTGGVFGVDHITLATTDDPIPFSADETLEMDRAALQSSIAKYVSASFQPEETACGVYAKDGSLVVTIASERPNLRNYWSGRWTSTWTIRNKTISGEVKIHAHYFEDGNVQLQTSKVVPATSLSGSLDEAVTAFIADVENTMRTGLDDFFGNLNNETLRAMRRPMTVTRTKMEWNVNAVRMIRQVRK